MTTEYIQFAAALVLMLVILIGSYWFVYAPIRKENRKRDEERKQADGRSA